MATMKNITINVTYSQLTALIADSGLFQGVNYLITDRGDRGLLFKAASRTQLEIQGTRYMLCPATYAIGADTHGNNWIGMWNNAKTAAVNDLTIWNGQVWKCIDEVTEPLDSPDLNAINWDLIPKATFANYEYTEIIFVVMYDVAKDWIVRQSDYRFNSCGVDYQKWINEDGNEFNPVDYTDWNNNIEFKNNICIGVWNNYNAMDISFNRINGAIFNNSCDSIYNNTNTDQIENNLCSVICNNSNNGGIYYNSLQGGVINRNKNNGNISQNFSNVQVNIVDNINNGNITGNWNANVTDAVVTKTGIAF